MSESESKRRQPVQSIARAFEILESIAVIGRPIGITEIAELSGLPVATAHRIINTLTDGGYALKTPRRTYALGPRLIPLARYAGGALGVPLRPLLAEFVQEVGESASVAMLDQDFARYISHVPSEHQMRVFAEVGNQVSLHSSGVGKAILSQLEDSQVRTILERSGMRALTPSTITSPDELITQLHEVRERGYAFDEGEHHLGVRCIAIPIPGPLHLAVSVSAPDSRLTEEVATEVVIPALRQLANRVHDAVSEAG